MNEILVKYFSARMLVTLDLNQLFGSLFDKFGESEVRFILMTLQERNGVSTKVKGVEAVNERYWIFHQVNSDLVRQRDLEDAVISLGQK